MIARPSQTRSDHTRCQGLLTREGRRCYFDAMGPVGGARSHMCPGHQDDPLGPCDLDAVAAHQREHGIPMVDEDGRETARYYPGEPWRIEPPDDGVSLWKHGHRPAQDRLGGAAVVSVDHGKPGGDYTVAMRGRRTPDGKLHVDGFDFVRAPDPGEFVAGPSGWTTGKSYPVTDPYLDAPDGAIIGGYDGQWQRCGDRWEPIDNDHPPECSFEHGHVYVLEPDGEHTRCWHCGHVKLKDRDRFPRRPTMHELAEMHRDARPSVRGNDDEEKPKRRKPKRRARSLDDFLDSLK